MHSAGESGDSNCPRDICRRYRPHADIVDDLGDLTAACGDDKSLVIPQGKSHVPFWEDEVAGKMYFATHIGENRRGQIASAPAFVGHGLERTCCCARVVLHVRAALAVPPASLRLVCWPSQLQKF